MLREVWTYKRSIFLVFLFLFGPFFVDAPLLVTPSAFIRDGCGNSLHRAHHVQLFLVARAFVCLCCWKTGCASTDEFAALYQPKRHSIVRSPSAHSVRILAQCLLGKVVCVCVFVWNMSLCFVCDHFSSLPHEEMAREAHGCRRPGGRACEETNRETWDEPQWIVAQGPLSALTIPRFILSRLQKICRFRNLKLQVPAHTL